MKEIYKEQLTLIVGRKGEKIAFKDMPVDLACEILKLIDEYDREREDVKWYESEPLNDVVELMKGESE